MFATQKLNELAERKRLLLLEAELHRGLIGLERDSLQKRLAGLRTTQERVASNRPLVIAGSTVAGLLALRHWRKLACWMPTALTALRWFRHWRAA
jgi:uncharacterized membrane protein YhiD involved in acid resistance